MAASKRRKCREMAANLSLRTSRYCCLDNAPNSGILRTTLGGDLEVEGERLFSLRSGWVGSCSPLGSWDAAVVVVVGGEEEEGEEVVEVVLF